MLNKISKYIRKIIFSFVNVDKTIQLTKISKEYINLLKIKEQINMTNFCKIFYQNDNHKPSLFTLLRHFKSQLPQKDFIEIYPHYMNNYIKFH